jgi:hypothetical protein
MYIRCALSIEKIWCIKALRFNPYTSPYTGYYVAAIKYYLCTRNKYIFAQILIFLLKFAFNSNQQIVLSAFFKIKIIAKQYFMLEG